MVRAVEILSVPLMTVEPIQCAAVTEEHTAIVALYSLQSVMATESEWHIKEFVKVRIFPSG